MGAIELANGIRCVTWQSASHSDMLANRLGAKIAAKPRRSISPARSNVASRRPGTATRLTAGSACDMRRVPGARTAPLLTHPFELLQRTDRLGLRRVREAGFPVRVGDLADVNVTLGIERQPVRGQELAGLESRPILATQTRQQFALRINDRQARTQVGRLQVDGHAWAQLTDHEGRRLAAAAVEPARPM